MSARPILLHPHATLKRASEPVATITPTVLTILEDMQASLLRADGIGLAAPQIGHNTRLIILNLGTEGPKGTRIYTPESTEFFINPEIIWASEETGTRQEGCLSLPGLWADVERPAEIKVRYLTREGAIKEEHATGLKATAFQHEIDHLNGILFIERLTRTRRLLADNKWKKLRADIIQNGGDFDLLDNANTLIPKRSN
jgi:peptide deformylase